MTNTLPFGQYHIGMKGLLKCKNEALTVCDGFFNNWTMPGGRINENEEPIPALKRELFEELNFDFTSVQHKIEIFGYDQWNQYKIRHDNINLFLVVFKIELAVKPEIRLSDEHTESRWITINDLKNIDFVNDITKRLYFEALNSQ